MISKGVFSALLVLLLGGASSAQDTLVLGTRLEGKATTNSLAGTFIPIVLTIPFISQDIPESNWNEICGGTLGAIGVLFGPGLGYLYAQDKGAFYKGVLIRSIGGGLILAGVAQKDSFYEKNSSGEILILAGSSIVLFSMIRDLSRVDNSVRKYNQKYGMGPSPVVPILMFSTNEVRLGVSLRL